jgi:hypothetical protein
VCDGGGTCTHPITWASNDLCNGSALSQSGSGASAVWSGSGDTYCAHDNYTSPCGGDNANGDTIGPDLVHYFDIPVEYDIYRYRAETAGPASFNPVEYFYDGAGGCGSAAAYKRCSDIGAWDCWSWAGGLGYDGDDACDYSFNFPTGRNYVVVDSQGAGGNYQLRIDRRRANTSDCSDPPLPELQLGGTWTGNTCGATSNWGTNMPYCVGSYPWVYCYQYNIFHINHATAPFNTLNRGYIVSVDGTFTPGGIDNSMFFAVNNCRSPWYLLSCDNSTYHLMSGPAGNGSQVVTGQVPAGWWGGIIVTSYPCWTCGNYTMRVQFDQDGDGIADAADGSNALMRGATAVAGGEGGAIQIPSWPWGAHGDSYPYPNNSLTARPGREVFYYYSNPSTRTMRARMYPRVRGDVWYGAASYLWDGVIWVYTPYSLVMSCRGTGGFWCGPGWCGCDVYGAGEWEEITVNNAPTNTYYYAVDSYTSSPQGGWYSIEFN